MAKDYGQNNSAQENRLFAEDSVEPASATAFAKGVGLHSGLETKVQIDFDKNLETPIFESKMESAHLSAPALASRLSGTARATALVLRGPSHLRAELRTVEHYLAALMVMGLPPLKAMVESFDGEGKSSSEILEMPILDGAAEKWIKILNVFDVFKPVRRTFWKVIRPFEIKDEDKSILLSPVQDENKMRSLQIHCNVDFGPHWKQSCTYTQDWAKPERSLEDFNKRIAPARTFGFQHELEQLKKRGLAMGGSLQNAMLLDDEKILNPGGFLVESELAAHKLIDVLGDFALLGKPLIGRIDTFKSGHSMHVRAVQAAVRSGALIEEELDFA